MSPPEASPVQTRVEQERTVYPHAVSFRAAQHQLELAEASGEGQFYAGMMAAISCAFALEVFLNLLGQEAKADARERFERSPPSRKLEIIGDVPDLQIERSGERPQDR